MHMSFVFRLSPAVLPYSTYLNPSSCTNIAGYIPTWRCGAFAMSLHIIGEIKDLDIKRCVKTKMLQDVAGCCRMLQDVVGMSEQM